jgi:hypothetical protein
LDRIGIVNEAFANVSYDSFKHHIQLWLLLLFALIM